MPRSFGPERQSVSPASVDDRSGAPPLVPGSIDASRGPDSTRDVAQEDFLFHLYRGSELLQDSRVLEAKEELEYALTMQPSDPKGQDLLGAVYFRLGLYPRAIQIYEGLERQFARDVSIKINLALCYLKTGQPEPARRVLQDAVRLNPEHTRAWGYLGLALQKLGELGDAQIAFERGGHPMMAKRVIEWRKRASMPAPSESTPEIDQGVREVAETAFSELDAGELRFSLAAPEPTKPGEGPWHTLELAKATTLAVAKTLPPAAVRKSETVHELVTVPPPTAATLAVPGDEKPAPEASVWTRVVSAPARDRETVPSLFGGREDRPIALHPAGMLLVRTSDAPARAFAGRLDALRVVAGPAATRVLHRRVREAETTEVLGGLGSPLVRIAGSTQLVFGPRPGHELVLLTLEDDLAFVREDLLLGFELRLAYENGRIAFEPGGEQPRAATDGVAVVQLRGSGAVALELAGALASIPSSESQPLLVRREWIVGWRGRLVARALAPADSPSGQRGLVSFSGEGTLLISIAT